VVLRSQFFNHCKPLSYGAGYPIFPGRIVVTFVLPSHDFLDGIHCHNYTRQPTSALLGFAILTWIPLANAFQKTEFRVPNVYSNPNHYPINTGVWNFAPASRRRGWCEMWSVIRRHISRHLCRGYWSVLRVERNKEISLPTGLFPRSISAGTHEPPPYCPIV